MSDLPFAMVETGFRRDLRFEPAPLSDPPAQDGPAEADAPLPDPLEQAYAQGHAAGYALAAQEAEARRQIEANAYAGLDLSLVRLNDALEESLRLRLRETVAALCEAALAPLALDEDALMRRIAAALAMLRRADDERVIRLNPADVAMLSPRFAADWTVLTDPLLERGAIRVENSGGGVEDGPETWRQAIAEALHAC